MPQPPSLYNGWSVNALCLGYLEGPNERFGFPSRHAAAPAKPACWCGAAGPPAGSGSAGRFGESARDAGRCMNLCAHTGVLSAQSLCTHHSAMCIGVVCACEEYAQKGLCSKTVRSRNRSPLMPPAVTRPRSHSLGTGPSHEPGLRILDEGRRGFEVPHEHGEQTNLCVHTTRR